MVPQQDGSLLGDGTLNYEIHKPLLCGSDGRLATNGYNENYHFEARTSLSTLEYLNGRLLDSVHKHHDYFELAPASAIMRNLYSVVNFRRVRFPARVPV
jgi:hypothetical protein